MVDSVVDLMCLKGAAARKTKQKNSNIFPVLFSSSQCAHVWHAVFGVWLKNCTKYHLGRFSHN